MEPSMRAGRGRRSPPREKPPYPYRENLQRYAEGVARLRALLLEEGSLVLTPSELARKSGVPNHLASQWLRCAPEAETWRWFAHRRGLLRRSTEELRKGGSELRARWLEEREKPLQLGLAINPRHRQRQLQGIGALVRRRRWGKAATKRIMSQVRQRLITPHHVRMLFKQHPELTPQEFQRILETFARLAK